MQPVPRAVVLALVLSAMEMGADPARGADPDPARGNTPAPAACWVYDRLNWNPTGDTLGLLAWADAPQGMGSARTLLVPVDPAGQVTVPPDVRDLQVAADGRSALLLGEQGLWWYELATGRLIQLHFQPPASTERLSDFAFRRHGPGVAFLTGAAGDRTGGFFSWVPGEPVTRLASRKPGSAPSPEWLDEVLPASMPDVMGMRSARRITIPGSPSLVLDYDGRRLAIDTGYGGNRAEVDPVTVAWADWPPAGGRVLVAVEDSDDGSSRLYAATAGAGVRLLLSTRVLPGAWLNDHEALVHSADGVLYRYDAELDSLVAIELNNPPGWATRPVEAAEVATLAVSRWPRSARKFEHQQNLVRSCAERLPASLQKSAIVFGRRLSGEGQLVGVFSSIEDAAAAAPAFLASGIQVTPVMTAAREMAGSFDYGSTPFGSGDRAFIRRLDSKGGGAEVWLERAGQAPIRLLTREMTR